LGDCAHEVSILIAMIGAVGPSSSRNGFLQGDIYPFCFNLSDGVIVAVANTNAKANLERTSG
jgi:hypothetical protein